MKGPLDSQQPGQEVIVPQNSVTKRINQILGYNSPELTKEIIERVGTARLTGTQKQYIISLLNQEVPKSYKPNFLVQQHIIGVLNEIQKYASGPQTTPRGLPGTYTDREGYFGDHPADED